MTLTMRAPRSRGMLTGFLLVLLGLWGALVPLVGPYWHFAYSPDSTWTMNSGRFWLSILPGIATVIGGLILLGFAHRIVAAFGAWLAALAGIWFVVGGPISMLWTTSGANQAGSPVGGATRQVIEQLTFFSGLGAVIAFLAGVALGRFLVIGVRDAAIATARREEAVEPVGPRAGEPVGTYGREPIGPRPGEPVETRGGEPVGPRNAEPMEPRTGEPVGPRSGEPVGTDAETASAERGAYGGWERTDRGEVPEGGADPIPRGQQPWRGRYARPTNETGDQRVAGTPRTEQNP